MSMIKNIIGEFINESIYEFKLDENTEKIYEEILRPLLTQFSFIGHIVYYAFNICVWWIVIYYIISIIKMIKKYF